ncbi:hypothetical protein [Microbacterium pumilum]|uniref:Anti-sigma factor n=1 Tax=Microbacterium pumilum TaxID=344165 RepID=A0ABN2RV93_9MICO
MDAADRAELDALRRRAYGRGADIHDQPAAVARLIELEDLARAETVTNPHWPARADDIGTRTRPASRSSPATAVSDIVPPARPPRRRWGLIASAIAVGAVAVAVALTQLPSPQSPAAAPTPPMDDRFMYHGDPGSETLMTISLDGAFGPSVDVPVEGGQPTFPATTTLDWALPLGEYFGWQLWVAGGTGDETDEHCILIQRGTVVRAQCLPPAEQVAGKLSVSLEETDIVPEELPRPMDDDESIRFWWLDSGKVDVVLGSFEGY